MKLYKFSIFLIFSGIILAVIFSLLGYAHFALFIIFPVIYSDNPVSAIPFVLIFIGILLLMLSPFASPAEYRREEGPGFQVPGYEPSKEERKKKFGGVILIGPIPIIIGNDKKLLYIAGAIAIAILLIFLFYYLR